MSISVKKNKKLEKEHSKNRTCGHYSILTDGHSGKKSTVTASR